jgi:DEAD/DEAH box helicase domain-containing protein
LHQGQQFHVEALNFEERKAYVKRVDVDYYTDAIRYTQVRVLECAASDRIAPAGVDAHATRSHGDVLIRSQVIGFKKIKFFTNENVGDGKLELPENEMHTAAFWLTLERALVESLPFSVSDRQGGMFGLLHALESIATLLLMCDARDLGTAIGERPPSPGSEIEWEAPAGTESIAALTEKEFFEPNLYLYDAYPGGIGFSEPLYRAHSILLAKTRELIAACPCENGCPSCVGPAGERGERAKEAALAILSLLGA